MTTTIDAGSAKLAGLQIDTLSKYRVGQVTLDQWERFNNLSPDDREARFGDWKKPEPMAPAKSSEKFSLFADLGIITVPENYSHATQLASFRRKNRKKFFSYDNDISDKHFPTPSRILKPGDRLSVTVFKQTVSGLTTSKERVAFLKNRNAVFTGPQGVSLVYEQKRDKLLKGYGYVSFDEKERLWQDAGGYRRVPGVFRDSDGRFGFSLGGFEYDWDDDRWLLCFCDLPAGEAGVPK